MNMQSPEFEEALTAMMKKVQLPPKTNGTAPVDTGIENVTKSGELSGEAFKQAADEAAKRCLESAAAVMQQASAVEEQCKKYADDLRKMGESHQQTIADFAAVTAKVMATMSEMRKLIENRTDIV